MKNSTFVVSALVGAVVIFGAFYFMQKTDQKPPVDVPSAPVSDAVGKSSQDLTEFFIRPHSQRVGNSMANVTVVEWFDPECESCRAVHPVFKKLIAEYKDRVLFVFRYMPYHQGSLFAATALEEANEFGKFPEALNLLYEHQPEWGSHHAPRPDLIPSYLTSLGIPPEKLVKEYLVAKHGEKIQTDKADGEKVGVEGTPTFFVNQVKVRGVDEESLRGAIEAALLNR